MTWKSETKKEQKNLVADHLSSLVNPEITEQEWEVLEEFLDEKLLIIQERPWFVDLENYKATDFIHEILIGNKRRSSYVMLINMYGMTVPV